MDKKNKSVLIWIINGFLIVSLCYKINIRNDDKAIIIFVFFYFLLIFINLILGFIFSKKKLPFYRVSIALIFLLFLLLNVFSW
jgi:hypothetical protein